MNPANYLIPILELYCEWLNRWGTTMDDPQPYELHQFMEPPGGARVAGIIPHVMDDGFVVIVEVSDGDEGGPHELTAYFELLPGNTTAIRDLIQGFDTDRQFVYQNRQFTNLPEGDQR